MSQPLRHGGSRLSVTDLQSGHHRGSVRAVLALGAITMLAALATINMGTLGLLAIGVLIVLAAMLVWLWREPVRSLYVLFAAAVLLPAYSTSTDVIGKYLPFFQDINTITNSKIAALSPGELLMVLALAIWLLKGIADRSLRFDKGSLRWPLGLYMLIVVISVGRGLGSGGNFTMVLWEVRAQIYMAIAYILTCNLIKHRSQVNVLIWSLMLFTGVRGIEGTIRYLFTIRGTGEGVNELFPHEQSYFFNGFLVMTIILFLYGGSRRMKSVALLLAPFVTIANLANNRRAAVVAFFVALFLLLVIMFITDASRRRKAGAILIVLAVVGPPYYLAYQQKSGTLALPARAVASQFNPNARDASSDAFRVNEDKDILAYMRTSPIIGTGFGRPIPEPYPLADILSSYPLEPYLPHDSILWVWMRLGSIGYVIFWFLIGSVIVQAAWLVRRKDPWVRSIALFVLLMMVQEIIVGFLDLQWTNYRNLIAVGVFLGLASVLRRWTAAEEVGEARTQHSEVGRAPANGRQLWTVSAVTADRARLVARRGARMG